MALKLYSGTIAGIEHTVQANSVDEAKHFVKDPTEVKTKAAAAPANKAAAPENNK